MIRNMILSWVIIMLVYRVFDENGFVIDHVIISDEMLNEYIQMGAELYRKENDEYYLWYDGTKWLFPRPDFNNRKETKGYNSEILSVLQEINSKLDNLS